MKLLSLLLVALAAVAPACGQTASSTTSRREPTTAVPDSTATLTSSASSESSAASHEGCPTVTLTSNVCRSCATPDCVQLVPLTNSCGCPSAIPTVFVDYPCESGCGGIGCAANYVFFTPNCTSDAPSSSSSSSGSSGGAAPANSTASATGTGPAGLNSTAGGMTSAGTSTRSEPVTSTGTAAETSSSVAAAGRMRPFWAGLL